MAYNSITLDINDLKRFRDKLNQAKNGGFREHIAKALGQLGDEFLKIVQDEIMRRQVVDTGNLFESFHRGSNENIMEFTASGMKLELEVGSLLEYASYVNDGHWTNPEGVVMRFVPGDVKLDSDGKITEFTYNPNPKKKTGMMLKQKWVPGKHYWEAALRLLEKKSPGILDKELQDYLDKQFGGFG